MTPRQEVVVCGAGIAGVATAYELAVRRGVRGVTLVDPRQPLTLTSDKGTAGYRNWWPGPDATMLRFMSRSIDLLEELAMMSGDAFRLNRYGYLFVTAVPEELARYRSLAAQQSAWGMGPVRRHTSSRSYQPSPVSGIGRGLDGADLLEGREPVRAAFPWLTRDVAGALHVRRAGYMDAIALGRWLLMKALEAGVAVVRDQVIGVDAPGGRLARVRLASGATLETGVAVLAPGPLLPDALRLLDISLPLRLELHAKARHPDPLGIVPAQGPMTLWSDPQRLPWRDDERARLEADPERHWLLGEFPAGVHIRPRGDGSFFMIWTWDVVERGFEASPAFRPDEAEILLRGLVRMIPGMERYLGQGDQSVVDGGYYCKAPDNRVLVGPIGPEGVHLAAGLSGYGLMASQAVGDLVAAHILGGPLPDYAPAFLPGRLLDPEYLESLEHGGLRAGQL